MKKMTMKNQVAFDYALYMISGSYFKKAVCQDSKYLESKLLLYYKEERRDSQYMMEEYVINFMEKYLTKVLPETIWQEIVAVSIRKKEDDHHLIHFLGEDFEMRIEAKKMKRKIRFIGEFEGLGKRQQWRVDLLA